MRELVLSPSSAREFFESLARHSGWLDSDDVSTESSPERASWLPRDLALRQLPTVMSAFAKVIAPHAFILFNHTTVPFITSDHPVYYGQHHGDELVGAGIDPRDMFRQIPRSAREFFVLCPLTPKHAYVASRFFPPADALRHRTLVDERMAIALNEVVRRNAGDEVYASVADPYGDYAPFVKLAAAAATAAAASIADSVRIYTEDDRFRIPTSGGRHYDGDDALHTRYAFTSGDLRSLQLVGNADLLEEITVFEAGREMARMREARFVAVAIDPDGESVIESGPHF